MFVFNHSSKLIHRFLTFPDGDRYEEGEIRRASSRGIIPRAKIKTVKMTFVIVFGNFKFCLNCI